MAAEGRISDPITFQEAQSMPYLQAEQSYQEWSLKEGRGSEGLIFQKGQVNQHLSTFYRPLFSTPAVLSLFSHLSPTGAGKELFGLTMAEQTHVGANSWVLHYDKDGFGQDADVYRPERWLQPEADGEAQNGTMFTFGGGSRACIGKNIGLLEVNKVLPQFVRKFNLVLNDKTTMETYCSWFVYPTFHVRIQRREVVE
ncbi:unnamed protein product [Clonostachys chloroleuca]|uniref:Cytochrome P450 n=1 Tax=Clonostachys chloroleuca TaxID=1926264 RepID=A0AA35MJY1_9HYPO|nr:unnamed protein product [Clonostachys chloroleuca]